MFLDIRTGRCNIAIMKNMNYPKKIQSTFNKIEDLNKNNPREALGSLRRFCEEFVKYQLFRINIEKESFQSQMTALYKSNALPKYIVNYIQHWYNVGCLGSHDNQLQAGESWSDHYSSCIDAANYVLGWYLKQCDDLFEIEELQQYSNNCINNMNRLDIDYFAPPKNYDDFKNHIKNNNLIFITGEPWMGKTLAAKSLCSSLFSKGYIPICFKEEIWQYKYEILPSFDPEKSDSYLGGLSKDVEKINQIIRNQTIFGNNFVIVLDDLFGNRKNILRTKNFNNTLISRLDIQQILNYTSLDSSFRGDIIFIITSPKQLFDEAIEISKNLNHHILSKNLNFLKDNLFKIDIDDYREENLIDIIIKNGKAQKCDWIENKDLVELISDQFNSKLDSLKNLYSIKKFIFDNKNIENHDNVLDNLIDYMDIKIEYILKDSNLTGEQIRMLSCSLLYPQLDKINILLQGKSLSFKSFVKDNLNIDYNESEWLSEIGQFVDVDDKKGDIYPTFIHPDISNQLEDLLRKNDDSDENIFNDHFNKLIYKIYERYDKWLVIHLLMANDIYLDKKNRKLWSEYLFQTSEAYGFDTRNAIWAVTSNLSSIADNGLRATNAITQRYRIQKGEKTNKKKFKSLLIREYIDNWIDLLEESREDVLICIGINERGYINDIHKDRYLSTLFYAITKNYENIKIASNQSNSSSYLIEAYNNIFKILEKSPNLKVIIKNNDGLYNDSSPTGIDSKEFLDYALNSAKDSGYISENSQLFTN